MYVGPDIVDDGLVFAMDAGSERTYPRNNLGVAWVDYENSLALGRYSIVNSIQPYSILLNTTYNSWVGYFGLTVPSAEDYTIMFDYVADATSSMYLDNDGVDNNNWNAIITVTTSVQTYNVTKAVTATGVLQFYTRRNTGGNITISNFRFFKSAPAFDIINNDEGTLTNGVGFSTDNGGIFTFDGVDDNIDTNFTIPAGDRSMDIWIKYDTLASSGGGGYSLTGVQQTGGKYLYTGITSDGGGYSYAGTSGGAYSYTFSAATWYHIALVMDSGTSKNYVNGVLKATRTYTSSVASTTEVMIGAINNQHEVDGSIPITRVYNKALTAAEVTQNFNAQRTRFGL